MPEDRVTITADASQYFDVLARAGVASDRLSGSGARIGEGFIRGDRVVRTATANITRSLLTAGSAADVAGTALEGLERVFSIGLLPTIAVGAGVAAFVALKGQVDAADEAVSKLSTDLAATSKTGGPEQLTASIARLTGELEDAAQKSQGIGPRIAGFLDKFINPLLGTSSHNIDASQKSALKAGIRDIVDLSEQRATVEEALNASQRAGLQGEGEALKLAERQAAADKIAIDLGGKLSAIDEKQRKDKLALFSATQKGILSPTERDQLITAQSKLAEREKASAIAESEITTEKQRQVNLTKDLADAEAKRQKRLKQDQTEAESATGFFEDVGSGKFLKNLGEKQQKDQQEERGRQLVEELRRDKESGIPLGPNAQAILKEADRLAARQGVSIQTLAHTDFSNLLELSKYDFSGLQPLSGLTLQIQ